MANKKMEDRLRFFWLVLIAIFTILLVRLGNLQLVQASGYRTISEENRVRMIPIKAPRGEILDRNGISLARNKQVFSVLLNLDSASGNNSEVVQRLSSLLLPVAPEITAEYINNLIKQSSGRSYEPIVIKRNIDIQMVSKIEELRQELPGVTVEVEPIREYPGFGEAGTTLAGHILGFVREINKDELDERNSKAEQSGLGYYQMGDLIGKEGLEKQYEDMLRGKDGARQVEVDAYNRPVRSLKTIPATAGNNLILTLDAKLQETLDKSMDQTLIQLQKNGYPKAKAGAAVVIDVNSGAILAMNSRPTLDPNDFVGTMSQEKVDFYYRSSPAAAIDRAISGAYPPGSTFKPITALAALEANVLKPETLLVNCTGKYWLPPYIKCWGVHKSVNLYQAMAVSCNTYFQEAGRLAGVDKIVQVADELGLGKKTGIDLPGEVKGLLPSPQWKRDLNARLLDAQYSKNLQEVEKRYQDLLNNAADEMTRAELNRKKDKEVRALKERYQINYNFNTSWQGFDTFNMSIGQGNNSFTPIQLASYVAAIANGGKLYKPFLAERLVSQDGTVVQQYGPKLAGQANINPANLAIIRQGMKAVMEPGGTGYSLFSNFPAEIKVAGKTGTAETGRQGDDSNKDYHGVFVAFAPADNPQIAFVGIIEYGYHGSTSAGYLAKAVFEQYFGITSTTPALNVSSATAPTAVPVTEPAAGRANGNNTGNGAGISVKPGNTTTTGKPSNPSNSTNPTNPTNPNSPTNPVDPAQGTKPSTGEGKPGTNTLPRT